jgi:hypothetical protein
MTLDQLVAAINGLDDNQKANLTAKLSASADKPHQTIKTLRAAAAAVPNKGLISQMLGNARNLGVDHLIKQDEIVNVSELHRGLAGKPVAARVELKEKLFQLGMIPA